MSRYPAQTLFRFLNAQSQVREKQLAHSLQKNNRKVLNHLSRGILGMGILEFPVSCVSETTSSTW